MTTRSERRRPPVVDLDTPAPPPPPPQPAPAPRSRPRRQCPYCYTNRSTIHYWALKGIEDRALQALRRAHPDEYDEYLQHERDTAYAAATEDWQRHLAHDCAHTTVKRPDTQPL